MSNQDVAVAEEIVAEEETVPTAENSSSEASETATHTAAEAPPEQTTETSGQSSPEEKAASVEESDEADASDETLSIYNLEVGQHLVGVVKNIVDFGAFVDVGIPQDGLVHISKLTKHKVDKVSDVVSQGQEIEVWVKKVDTKRGRLSLTMVKPVRHKLKDIDEGAEFEGVVTRLESYGAFVDIESDRDGLVHISQITHEYIKHPEEALRVGDAVRVKVLNVNRKKRQIDLSIKALLPPPVKEAAEAKSVAEKSPVSKQKAPKPEVKEEILEEVLGDGEPQLTAMAIAYAAALQEKEENKEAAGVDAEEKQQKNTDMDDIVARTLASREK